MILTKYDLWQQVDVHCREHIFGTRSGVIKEILISSAWVLGPGVLYKVEGKGLAGYYPESQLKSPNKRYEKLLENKMRKARKNYKKFLEECRKEEK